MRIYKEDAVSPSQQFATKILINNVETPSLMVGTHWHDYYEVLYIMDGEARQTIEGQCTDVASGDIVLIQPGETHNTLALSEQGCGIIVLLFFPSCLNFDNRNNLYSRYLGLFMKDFKNISGYLRTPYPYQGEILRLMSKLSEEYYLGAGGYELITKGLLYEFLGYLQRIGGLSISTETTKDHYLQVVEICRYIEEHYNSEITLGQIARKAGYSKEYFSKLFKDVVGDNFKTFLDYVRITEAQRMLAHEHVTVSEVAERVGYCNLNSFSRAFKRVKGCPPSEISHHANLKN